MVRLIARAAVAGALAAAVAAPLTQGAWAGTLPTAPAPSAPSGLALPAPLDQLAPVPLAPATPSSTSNTSSTSSASDPSSTANANALEIPPLGICVSCTNGQSSTPPSTSNSNSTALKLFGQTIAGGSASGDQTNSGAILALPANPLLSLAIADWFASATSAPSTAERAALLDLDLNPDGSRNNNSALTQLVTLAVLEAKSTTTASCEAGGATGETNGVNLNLGNGALVVILLHANASTNSPGSVYLASINGNQILSGSQVPPAPQIVIPGLGSISLLATPASGCGNTTPPPGCSGVACVNIPPGGTLGNGFTANQSSTSGANAGVQAAATGPSTGVPTTGIALGILGFLLLGGGLIAMAASRFVRRWRRLA
jgi:hypothetical protein